MTFPRQSRLGSSTGGPSHPSGQRVFHVATSLVAHARSCMRERVRTVSGFCGRGLLWRVPHLTSLTCAVGSERGAHPHLADLVTCFDFHSFLVCQKKKKTSARVHVSIANLAFENSRISRRCCQHVPRQCFLHLPLASLLTSRCKPANISRV